MDMLFTIMHVRQPFRVNPKPFQVNPEPFRVNPKPFRVNPEPFRVNPEPFRVNPKPFRVNPEPFRVNPEPFRVNPEPFRVNPETARGSPETARGSPETVKEILFPKKIIENAKMREKTRKCAKFLFHLFIFLISFSRIFAFFFRAFSRLKNLYTLSTRFSEIGGFSSGDCD
jgi:peroxisome proliferator-activated receptor gamma coactivator-related protein 1